MTIATNGIDIGKSTFHVCALDERSHVRLRKAFSCSPPRGDPATWPGETATPGSDWLGRVRYARDYRHGEPTCAASWTRTLSVNVVVTTARPGRRTP